MGGVGIFQGDEQKQMFTNVEVNLLIPNDISVINSQFKLIDYIDDHIEEMDRLQFFVSDISISYFLYFILYNMVF